MCEHSGSNWNLEMLVFLGKGKTGVPGEKPLGAEKRTNNKLDPHGNRAPGHIGAWEASALTTTGTPSLLPYNEHQLVTSTDYHELTYRQGPVVQNLDLSGEKITSHWTSTIKTY